MDIFFDEIIYQAKDGIIKFENFVTNINFNTKLEIENEEISIGENDNIPTLLIKNLPRFNKILNEYLLLSREFYKDKIDTDLITEEEINKYLLSIVWCNATEDDFNNPELFLKRYMNFMNDNTFDVFFKRKFGNELNTFNIFYKSIEDLINHYNISINKENLKYYLYNKSTEETINFCLSNIDDKRIKHEFNEKFKSILNKINLYKNRCITIKVEKCIPRKETPYSLSTSICDIENNELYYPLPSIKFGIDNGVCYIYTIHNDKKNLKKNINLSKELEIFNSKTDKLFYRINDDYINSLDKASDIEEPENIKSIMPQAIVSLTILISLLQEKGIKKIVIPDYLPIRWNAKELSDYKRSLEITNPNERELFLIEKNLIHENIQRNLTDKLIRNFRRLGYHFKNIELESVPKELGSFSIVKTNDSYECNNGFLDEIYTNSREFIEKGTNYGKN